MAPVRIFFVLAFSLTWGIGGLGLLIGFWWPGSHPLSTSSPLYYLAAYSVSLAGMGLTLRYAGREGLRNLVERLIPWRSSPAWYAIVVAGYAAITGVALLAVRYFGAPTALPGWRRVLSGLGLALLKDPGPLGEEFGWRGFALPRLLERHSPINASVRLGLIHTAWHLPLFFIPGMPQTQVSLLLFAIGVVSIAVIATALYLRTGANLLLAMLVHLLANVGGGFAVEARALNYFLAAEGIAAIVIIALGGLRTGHQRVPACSS
jgi:membrane protease YdiL (CAAX protease family)